MFRAFNGSFFALPPIETPRLLLRKITMADARDIFAYSGTRKSPATCFGRRSAAFATRASTCAICSASIETTSPRAGASSTRRRAASSARSASMSYSADHNSAEIGYSLARDYWNRGIMTEAVRAVLRYAFEKMQLHRVEAQFELDNPASGRVMEKAGMQKEGVLRGRLYNKGRYVDVALYAILREDYMSKTHGGHA